jgi:hypothetical protein
MQNTARAGFCVFLNLTLKRQHHEIVPSAFFIQKFPKGHNSPFTAISNVFLNRPGFKFRQITWRCSEPFIPELLIPELLIPELLIPATFHSYKFWSRYCISYFLYQKLNKKSIKCCIVQLYLYDQCSNDFHFIMGSVKKCSNVDVWLRICLEQKKIQDKVNAWKSYSINIFSL